MHFNMILEAGSIVWSKDYKLVSRFPWSSLSYPPPCPLLLFSVCPPFFLPQGQNTLFTLICFTFLAVNLILAT